MHRRLVQLLLIGNIIISCSSPETEINFLSQLSATEDTPLFATYAAAMERSQFILDEGYEYNFYTEGNGIDFTTDTGGDLGFGFVFGETWVYNLEDLFRRPEVSSSYPDMVVSFYYPIEGLRVESTFLVESSTTAIHEISIKNEKDVPLSFTIVPFMRNKYRTFNDVEILNDSTFYFKHEEFPDSWTLSHGLPYEDTIQNIFTISELPDSYGSFNGSGNDPPSIPWTVFPEKQSMYELRGRSLINGKRNLEGPGETRFYTFVNGNRDRMITENSPVWGTMQGAINKDGYYRAELGNLDSHEGSIYDFLIFLENEKLAARLQGMVGELGSTRQDTELIPYKGVSDVQDITGILEEEGFRLSWKQQKNRSVLTRLYRRKYPDETYYTFIGDSDSNTYLDQPPGSGIYGYVLCHFDPELMEMGPNSREFTTIKPIAFDQFIENPEIEAFATDFVKYIAFRKVISLGAGEEKKLKIVRMVGRKTEAIEEITKKSLDKISLEMSPYIEANENLFSKIVVSDKLTPDMEHLYWSSFNMMRQVFYPPEGKSDYNYYVFSREPAWGWGHGGQVFHESLTIPAYAMLDPVSAMNSQRVYSQRQYKNGYINYRTGSYLDEKIEYDGQLTSSAPWYNYQNWELYQITRDREFLQDMYESGKKFYNFYVSNRDMDNDGLCEWGGHAILESVRDAFVAVWDEVGWPSNFEGLDLNCMLVMEAKALENMAKELGIPEEAEIWKYDWNKRSDLINNTFWDEQTGFYYHVDMKDHDFTFEDHDDLKRQEIIGFLPIWAGVASEDQARSLVGKLKDPNKFWRKYGIPSLSADDTYYNDKGYWNGPVWVEWNYLIVQGLLDYGYYDEAKELTQNVANGMIHQLKTNHNLWEFYSPDTTWAGYHKTYFWAGIINKMIRDVQNQTHESF